MASSHGAVDEAGTSAAIAGKTKFSAALNIPFSRRTWPSMATADSASRTGAWLLTDERAADGQTQRKEKRLGKAEQAARSIFSTGILEDLSAPAAAEGVEERCPRLGAASSSSLPPPPPPRAPLAPSASLAEIGSALLYTASASQNSTTTTSVAADPKRLANLFGYSLANNQEITSQKLHKVNQLYDALKDDVARGNAAFAEGLRTQNRTLTLPLSEHLTLLEDLESLHRLASVLLKRFSAMEEVLVRAVVKDALSTHEKPTAEASDSQPRRGGSLSPFHSRLRCARSFVHLEMALLSMRGCDGAVVSTDESERQLHANVEERWSAVTQRLPLDEVNYYDVLDCLHRWGPGWSFAAAVTDTLEPNRLVEARAEANNVSALLTSAPVLAKVSRLLDTQRERTSAKNWLSFSEACGILQS